jgi:7,8-dihydroneopterin aldolase/epimerase/oxygenase
MKEIQPGPDDTANAAMPPMDCITIQDLEVFCHVGVPDAERARPQRLLLTVTMHHDVTAAARVDDLAQTVDYHAVSQRLLRLGDQRSWRLIETLAVEIAELVLKEFRCAAVTVEVKKFILPQAAHVSVRVHRTRR